MNDINSNFSFKFIYQDKVFKEIVKLDWNKGSQKMIFQSKWWIKTSISSLIFYIITSVTLYLAVSFPVN